MKPPCYGHFNPMTKTACGQCAKRNQCAFKTSPEEGFVVLPMPRMRREFTRREVVPTVTSCKALAEANESIKAAGYKLVNEEIFAGTRKVADIHPGYGATFRLVFDDITMRGIRGLREADRVDVRPVVSTSTEITHKSTVAQMRQRHRGCFAVCLDATDALRLLRAAARTFFEAPHG